MLRFLSLCISLAPLQALALPSIGVVGLHQEDLGVEEQRRIAESLAAAIDQTGNFDGVGPAEISELLNGREELVMTQAFLAQGRRLLDDGRLQYQQAEPDFAIPMLENAVKELGAAMAWTPTQREYWDALVYLGAAKNSVGDRAATMRAFSAAVGVNPERRPSTRQFPPQIVEIYEGIASDLQGRVATIEVNVKSKDAVVWVDGIRRGVSPVSVEVLPGEHFVMVRTASGLSGSTNVALGPKSTVQADIDLQPARLGLTPDSKFVRTRETAAMYEALAEHVEVDFWLVSGEYDEAMYAALYAPASGSWSQYVRVPLMEAGDDETRTALDELMTMIDNGGSLKRDFYADTAIPLDRSSNDLLADMLIRVDGVGGDEVVVEDGRKFPIWVIPTAVLGAAALGFGGYGVYRGATHDPNQGQIVVTLP